MKPGNAWVYLYWGGGFVEIIQFDQCRQGFWSLNEWHSLFFHHALLVSVEFTSFANDSDLVHCIVATYPTYQIWVLQTSREQQGFGYSRLAVNMKLCFQQTPSWLNWTLGCCNKFDRARRLGVWTTPLKYSFYYVFKVLKHVSFRKWFCHWGVVTFWITAIFSNGQ
jgi:hypothetical protein